MKKMFFLAACLVSACSCAPVRCTFFCEEPHYQIYLNDEYAGTNFAHYTAKYGTLYVTVSIRNGVETVYVRDYYVKDYHKNELVDVVVPEEYVYSTSPKTHYNK